jgi:hypothetical protein
MAVPCWMRLASVHALVCTNTKHDRSVKETDDDQAD